jgi:hypothetical protein
MRVDFASKKVERPSGRSNTTILVTGSAGLAHMFRPQREHILAEFVIMIRLKGKDCINYSLSLLKMRHIFHLGRSNGLLVGPTRQL